MKARPPSQLIAALPLAFALIAACGGGGGDGGETAVRVSTVAAVPGAVAEAEGVRITLNEVADPFVSIGFFSWEPHRGRFVAFDVTIKWTKDSGLHYVGIYNFTLSDTKDFAYESDSPAMGALDDNEPALEETYLGSGQETRGWIAFEVDADTPLKLLKYVPDRYGPDMFTTDDIEFHFE